VIFPSPDFSLAKIYFSRGECFRNFARSNHGGAVKLRETIACDIDKDFY